MELFAYLPKIKHAIKAFAEAGMSGAFIFTDDDETFLRPSDIGNQLAAQ
jgi:hypothetical protein